MKATDSVKTRWTVIAACGAWVTALGVTIGATFAQSRIETVKAPRESALQTESEVVQGDSIDSTTAGVSLLRNPSFEVIPGPQQGQGLMPSDWTIIAVTPDTYSNDGTYGLPPSANGNFPGVVAQSGLRWVAALGTTTAEMFGQQLSSPLLPNQAYHITGWLHRALRADLAHPGTYELLLSSTPPNPATSVVLGRFAPTTAQVWERRVLSFIAPADSTSRPWLIFKPAPTGSVPSTYPGLDTLDLQAGSCSTELCNGQDDDCDGQVDEGFGQMQFHPDLGQVLVGIGGSCVYGSGPCERPGTVRCTSDGTGARCAPNSTEIPVPNPEGPYGNLSCFNLEDDDCDGLVDHEDPNCQGLEICDGFDNDNDGQVDELWPLLRQPCTVGLGACVQHGVWQCAPTGNSVQCSATPLHPGQEGPPGRIHCEDGADNDCDGLTDIHDPDCQSPEICDKKDNNGNGQMDENFPLLGRPCIAGLGECARDGFYDCTSDGTGVRCSAPPGPRRPEGVGCACGDGLDNDCDGFIDEADPDCGSAGMRVQVALPVVCRNPDRDCHSWHTVNWATIGAGPELHETAELAALGADGSVLGTLPVARGDRVRLTSRAAAANAAWNTRTITADLRLFDELLSPCLGGPDTGVALNCAAADRDCDRDLDLVDFAWFQNHLNETETFHEMTAPRPVLRVVANDGFSRATGYASPLPHVQVWSPDQTVVSLSEGDRIRVEASIPLIDLATLELLIDGVSVFPAIGVIPGIAFPGGPFDGSVTLPNHCVAEVCGLLVDAGGLDSLASNTLTLFVEGMCCGGHRIVVRGSPRANVYPNPVPATCSAPDGADDGVSYGFEVTILNPSDGEVVQASPTSVLGIACHGIPLDSPIAEADRRVRLNGEPFPLNPPSITVGDGLLTADTCRYTFGGLLPRTDLFDDLVLGIGEPGRLDPGGNKLIAKVTDPRFNTTYDVHHIGVGPMTPNPAGGAVIAGGGSAVPHGFSVTVHAAEFTTIVTESLEALAGPAVQAMSNFLESLRGTEMVFPTDACDINLTLLDDNPVPYDFTMNAEDFSYTVNLLNNQVDLRAASGPIHAAGSVWGSCRVNLFGGCFIRVVVRAGAEIDIDTAAIDLSVTENDLITRADLTPALVINEDDLHIHVEDVSSDVACWGGALLQILTFGGIEGLIDIVVVEAMQAFLGDLDVQAMLDLMPVPPIPLDVLDFDPVNIAALDVDFNFGLTEVQISPEGVAVGFETEFVPTDIDPEVAVLPGIPATIAALPLPPLPDPPAHGLTALIADDAINQLFYALTRNGILKTEFEDDRRIGALLPANCGILPSGAYGLCVALKGENCAAIPAADAFVCLTATPLLAAINVSDDTTILLQGRLDVPPKLLAFSADENNATLYIRLSQAYVGIVADRDGDGEFTGDAGSLPSCFAANPGTTTECTLWGACFNVNFTAVITLGVGPGGNPRLTMDVTDSDLSTATDCSGATSVGGGLPGLKAVFEGPVFALIQSYLDKNVPPLDLPGLDFGGIVTLENLRPLTHGNEFDTDFEDAFGLTAEVVPSP